MNDHLAHAFVQDFVSDPGAFILDIHPNDEMFSWSPNSESMTSDPRVNYLVTGRRMLSNLRPIVDWAFGGFEGIGGALDFAAGYGRLTRHLIQELPSDRIWISDIQEEAVQFQIETFGVHGFTSTVSPQNVSCDRLFDLVFVASLFSHLPHPTFTPWLKWLYDLLTDRGILVFSVHDITLTELPPDRHGITFIAQSESDRLDPHAYGTSYVSEAYTTQAVRSVTGRTGRVRRIAKGLCDYQDLYVVAGRSREDLQVLDTSRGLIGYLENRIATDGGLVLGGWAHDFSPSRCDTEILVLVNGVVVDRCAAAGERQDVATHFADRSTRHCGWSVSIPLKKLEPCDVVSVKAVSTDGRDLVLLLDTVDSLRPTDTA